MKGDMKTVAKYQGILVNSAAARALAIRAVINNGGSPGIDKFNIDSPEKFWEVMGALLKIVSDVNSYKPLPAKRILIPKASGGDRPLGIPTTTDRSVQTLYAFALEPIAEASADVNSFGFRKKRGTLDAIFTLYQAMTSGTT